MRFSPSLIFAAALLWLTLPAGAAVAQPGESPAGALRVSPSGYRLLASGVRYAGVARRPDMDEAAVKWRREHRPGVVAGGRAYYVAHIIRGGLGYEGLAEEDLRTGGWTLYPMSGLAVAAGWYRPAGGRTDGYPNSVGGLYLAGETLWMGTNGMGVVAYDTRRRTWARYDRKREVVAGRHVHLNYADADYAFVTDGEFPSAAMHVYSARRRGWRRLDAVPTKNVTSYGHTGPYTQVTVNHAQHAHKEYLPVDWSVAMLDRVTPLADGTGYEFEQKFTEDSRTVFRIHRQQLGAAFD